ncbi:MAG TPA: methylmalonyl Co-A mutase-associated GTPase MeaB [Mycobacteriales bacterium]|nr:methylmalonyl Co-A mutase-associated GTPase MeaB [Mycobacteriales bacterium]
MDVDVAALRSGSRTALARAITLIESTRPDHRKQAGELLVELLPDSGNAYRIGISGVPGAGKSTLIESVGGRLTAAGHKVAVLTVDPSSSRSGGSILGDKTRMPRLAADPATFIRPSPTSGTLGGVATATRETIVLVEAAGYDIVLVETVGVGQSEIAVAGMVDCFLLLVMAGAGDSLQGIKQGVLELADVVAVNKADGPAEVAARRAARELTSALRLLRNPVPPVLACSALTGAGLDEVWSAVEAHRGTDLDERRRQQQVDWTWALVRAELLARLDDDASVSAVASELERRVRAGELTPALAAGEILRTFGRGRP